MVVVNLPSAILIELCGREPGERLGTCAMVVVAFPITATARVATSSSLRAMQRIPPPKPQRIHDRPCTRTTAKCRLLPAGAMKRQLSTSHMGSPLRNESKELRHPWIGLSQFPSKQSRNGPLPEGNCRGRGEIVDLKLAFVGTIRFEGEQAYPAVNASQAGSKEVRAFKQTCSEEMSKGGGDPSLRVTFLTASSESEHSAQRLQDDDPIPSWL